MPANERPTGPHDPTTEDMRPAGKGRPTPKRRDAETARQRPLVPNPKEATRAKKVAAKAVREREYQAMLTGEERHMPARDKGPVRRWTRDYVDARRNIGEYFLPVSITFVLMTFFTAGNTAVGLLLMGVLYLLILVNVADAVVLSFRLKKRLAAKFGAARMPRGIRMYGVLRAFQIRRTRLPKPMVKRGEYPR